VAIGLHAGGNLFGPGVRANATIGRVLRLVLLNCLDCRPGVLQSTLRWAASGALLPRTKRPARGAASRESAVSGRRGRRSRSRGGVGHNASSTRRTSRRRCWPPRRRDGRARQPEPGRSVTCWRPSTRSTRARRLVPRAHAHGFYEHARRPRRPQARGQDRGAVPAQRGDATLALRRGWTAPAGAEAHARVLPATRPSPSVAVSAPTVLLCVARGRRAQRVLPSWSRGRSVPFVTKEVPHDAHLDLTARPRRVRPRARAPPGCTERPGLLANGKTHGMVFLDRPPSSCASRPGRLVRSRAHAKRRFPRRRYRCYAARRHPAIGD
jgi:hypothetical protein